MMKKILPLITVLITVLLSVEVTAQNNNETTYFSIEGLTTENYTQLLASMNKNLRSSVVYACIPAKIIGVDKDSATLFKNKLALTYKSIKQTELTQKEAENKCSSQRSYK